jgi:hypothetical protein
MQNMREILKWDNNYSAINREERNLGAILFYVLNINDNLGRFLKLIDYQFEIVPLETGIYFEYSYIRDLWYECCLTNDDRRSIIYNFLTPNNKETLIHMTEYEFNKYFGAVPAPSRKYIQSPGNWSLPKFVNNINDPDEFLKVCKFKWSFKAKPDIVIHTSKNHAVCIELKLESTEGRYPQKGNEKSIFKSITGKEHITQTELQKYLMEDILGIKTQFLFLVNKSSQSSQSHTSLQWSDVFRYMDIHDVPAFMIDTINTIF